jgi:hypothetical protein
VSAIVTILPVDRWRAAMRAAWMMGLGVLIVLLCRAFGRAIHWREMWAADRFTLVAEVTVLGLFALIGLALALAGGRWLLLVIWPKPTQVEIGPDAIVLRLGPFGTHALDWRRMRVEPQSPADAEFALPDDDPILPRMEHPDLAGDVVGWIARFTGATPAELHAALPRIPPADDELARDLP